MDAEVKRYIDAAIAQLRKEMTAKTKEKDTKKKSQSSGGK